MFKWETNSAGFSFFIENALGEKVPVNDWHNFQDEYLSQLMILNEWVDNGQANKSEGSIDAEVDEVLKLNEIDLTLLGLPELYPYVVFIEADGIMNQPSFRFTYSFYDFVPNGNRLFFKKNEAILSSKEALYLLSQNQYKVLSAIEKFNSLPETERTYHGNLKCFADIKGFSKDEATILDAFLQTQEVLHPEKIKIDVSFENETLDVTPHLDSVERKSFIRAFDLSPRIKPIYNVKNEKGGTTRLLIDDEQQKGLDKIKKKRRISDPKLIEELTENPEKFFDDNIFDLSYFSQRVREIGVYKPKFYPFVCPYKSEWIPGIVIKDKVNGEKKIHFKTEVELAEFEAEKKHAEEKGKAHFSYKEETIAVEDAEKFIEVAKKQFANPKEPVNTRETTSSEEVLIIKENAELLEYIENGSYLESLDHQFNQIGNLVDPIKLKEHQIEGVAWLQSLSRKQLNGCLLADDMGLGKTLQILYFIEWHAQNFEHDKPYLVVAPVSLLENWQNEYKKFFSPNNLNLKFIYGPTGVGREFSKHAVAELQKRQILLTNYESLRAFQLNMCAVDYAVVVLDEAQKIKTPGTMVTNVSKALKADFKIAMTGTPVENTLVDLWCIMDFTVPGLLGNAKDFAKEYQKPLSNEETDVSILGEKLREQIGVFIKRRLKSDVAKDLPEKRIQVLECTMPEAQVERYSVEISLAQNEDLEGVNRRNQILKSLWAIRDISDHPYLVDNQVHKYSTKELISSSAKLQVVIEVLEKVKTKGEKAIIFADRRETQKLLQKVIYDIFKITPPSIINGDTPSSKQKASSSKLSRQQTIDRFQIEKGFNVIIMSQLAAGVGLNVTGANHVIHYSRHWNPAKEEQATDRAYRIGQEKNVTVYYPMAIFPESFRSENGERPASFDQILEKLLTRKKTLASSTLFPTEQSEVKPDEIFQNVFQTGSQTPSVKPLSLEQVEKLNPRLFEAFVAALFTKQGYQVHLTPFANDKGVDVVAMNSHHNYLVQAKQSLSALSNDAIQEVFTSKNYYRARYKEDFKMTVLTNSKFGGSAKTLADSNEVELIEREELKALIKDFPVSIREVHQHEAQRLERI